MSDPFIDEAVEREHDGTKSVGLCVPMPLTSAELEEKYAAMRHDGLELSWPVLFEDADGHIDPISDNDVAALARVGVTPEEFYAVELERVA